MSQDKLSELEAERAIAVLMEERASVQASAPQAKAPEEGINFSKLLVGVDDMDDFELGSYLKGMGSNFFDQLDTGARFFNRGVTLNQSDKIYAGVEAMMPKALGGGATYDEALARNRARNDELKEKNPTLAMGAELTGAFTGIGKLQKVGGTFTRFAPQVADKATKTAKALGFGGSVAAGTADAAALSAVMAYGDDKEVYDAGKSGAMWGAAFSVLPPALGAAFKSAIAKRIGAKAEDMYDKAGNFIPIHLAKGDHLKLKTIYKQFVGEGLTGQPLIEQQKKVIADVERRMAKVSAHDTARGATRMATNLEATRGAKAADVAAKNAAVDAVGDVAEKSAAKITGTGNAKLNAAEIKIKVANTKLQNQILNDARPSSLKPVIGVGTSAQKELKNQWKGAYDDAWNPVTKLDETSISNFVKKATRIKKSLNNPTDKATLGNIITEFKAISKGGKGDLREFDKSLRQSAYSAGVKGDSLLQSALHSTRDIFTKGLPKTTQKGLTILNKKYPNYLVVKDAGNNAIKNKGIFTADQMYNSVKKVGKGTGATGEANLQTQADVFGDTVVAQNKTISSIADDTASQLAANAEMAGRSKLVKARELAAGNVNKAHARTDATNMLKKSNAARTDAHTAPFKNELDRLKNSAATEGLKLPTKFATSSAAGLPISLMAAPMTGGSGFLASPLVGAAQGKFLTMPGVQKAIYGHTPTQQFMRKEAQQAADLLRSFDKTHIPSGFKPGISAELATHEDEQRERPQRRR